MGRMGVVKSNSRMPKKPTEITNIVTISDSHFGSTLGLCSPKVRLDDGGWYTASPVQEKIWGFWKDFWKWTFNLIGDEPFALVHNGDIVDGDHHGTTALFSHNLKDQENLAVKVMSPIVERAALYFQIRGTEAHVGQSASFEERVAERLGAVVDEETGQHSRWELCVELGHEIIHFSHHIGTTSSVAYESSALMREIAATFMEAGQWGQRPPTVLVRSHRHRYCEVKPPNCRILVTPGWQGKTSFVFKMDRMRMPQFGGVIIRLNDNGKGVHARERVYTLSRSQPVNFDKAINGKKHNENSQKNRSVRSAWELPDTTE